MLAFFRKRLFQRDGIEAMEKALDRMFLENPGKIIPRNGSAGPTREEFTADWNQGT